MGEFLLFHSVLVFLKYICHTDPVGSAGEEHSVNGSVEHPYLIQTIALWCSFLPGLLTLVLLASARLEQFQRAAQPVTIAVEGERSWRLADR